MELTRRSVLQAAGLGALALGGLAVPWNATVLATSASTLDARLLPQPYRRSFSLPPSLRPAATGVDDDGPWATYVVREEPASLHVLPSGAVNAGFGYAGSIPGPTIHVERGTRVVAKVRNRLQAVHPLTEQEFVTSTHLHGNASLPEYDGYASDVVRPGQSKTYQWPSVHQPARTLWYHDHAYHRTAQHVYTGLVGQYQVHDEVERALLPAGRFDVPLTVSDVMFAADGSLGYDDRDRSGLWGDVVLVNGVPWPVLRVQRRIYRFRMLNASVARSYRPVLVPEGSVHMVATDGGLMPRSREVTSWRHGSGERYEFLIDFTRYPAGTRVELRNLSNTNNRDFDHTGSAESLPHLSPPVVPAPGRATGRQQVRQGVCGRSATGRPRDERTHRDHHLRQHERSSERPAPGSSRSRWTGPATVTAPRTASDPATTDHHHRPTDRTRRTNMRAPAPGRRSRRRVSLAALLSIGMLATGAVVAPPTALAVTDANPSFEILPSDLEFILEQIKISENHAAGGKLLCPTPTDTSGTCVPHPQLPWGLRTVDGSFNNLMPNTSKFGAADQTLTRLLDMDLRPGVGEAPPPGAPQTPGTTEVCADFGTATCYHQTDGFTYDSHPRVVSNLIVDQTTDNPAAVAVAAKVEGSTTEGGTAEGGTAGRIFIPNESPDEGLSAPFNTWMTFFGQFFDHGLDLVSKGNSGTVVVPLKEDDPLYRDPAGPDGVLGTGDDVRTNFLQLTRATNEPGPDGVLGTADDVRDHNNRTTPFVDQNQTYTSHPSHHVFLREYRMQSGRPVATGHLLDGAKGGLANWAEVKTQARTKLGIALDDHDVVNVPLLRTDPYGNFVPGTNGLPQIATANGFAAASLSSPRSPAGVGALRTNHAFLDDIAHTAAPFSSRGDTLQRATDPGLLDPRTQYDGNLLDAHFITGDGRGNENIGLTAVHHIFHAEHNRVADDVDRVLTANPKLKTRYQAEGTNRWSYGQRLFQAARFITEMEYQHLVFEEFGRTLSPSVDPAPFNESTYHTDLNAAITAEFAHVVYRFGHSMLTETVHRDGFGATDLSLLDAFLDPHEFTMNGALTPHQAAGAIVNGMVANPGSGIDEFVTETLRNELLGLPLDLAAINIMRGRDTAVPPLQTARRTFYGATGDTDLKPYANWKEFGLAMRNPESLVNFIAAYGTHPSITAAATAAGKRAAAQALVDGRNAHLTESAATSGLDTVDFWMGGLAERNVPFAGFLGTTFNHVFETQLERLQNGDRFYYLNRNIGLNLFHQLEANSFASIIMRTTDASLLPAEVFTTPDHTFDLNQPDPGWDGLGFTNINGVWTYKNAQDQPGEGHINVHGTPGPDRVRSGIGDDALWGGDGDDAIRGGAGVDSIVGGRGADLLHGEGSEDNIKAGPGDDAVHGGSGADLLFGGSGKDVVFHGTDETQSFAGTGDDFVIGGDAHDILAGNEGDDWLEGGAGSDLVQGDNSNGFQNDPDGGHDVLFGGSGNDDLDAEGGDDTLITSPGTDRHEGMLGYDWVTHRGDPNPANADMDNTAFQPADPENFADRYDLVEGLSGWSLNDILRGVGRGDGTGAGHELTQAHLDRVTGLRDLLGGGANPPHAAGFMTANTANDLILGGTGSDLLEGRGGNDFLDGRAALNVQLKVGTTRYDSLAQLQTAVLGRTVAPGAISIVREIVTVDEPGAINSAAYSGNASEYTCKVVGARGNGTACHRLTPQSTPQMWTVEHTRPGGRNDPQRRRLSDGLDTLRNIEQLRFADTTVPLLADLANTAPVGTVTIVGLPAREGAQLVASNDVTDGDGIRNGTRLYTWQVEDEVVGWTTAAGTATTSPGGISNDQYTPTAAEVGKRLRVSYTYSDGRGQTGTLEEVISDPTEPVLASGETAPPSSTVTATPSSLAFGDQPLTTTSAAQSITVTNTGTATVTVSGVTLTGADEASFAQSNGCTDVAAGGSCSVDVTFTPTTAGAKAADVEIAHTGSGSPTKASLTGTGVEAGTSAPEASVSPTSLDFLDVEVGRTSTSQVNVVNTGTANLSISGVTVVGTDDTQFRGTPEATCATMAPGDSCTVSVTFAPTSEGAKSGTLDIAHNAAGSPSQVTLAGNGVVTPAQAAVLSMPATVDFGTRRVGQTRTKNVQVSNTGTVALEISDVTATATSAGATFTATTGNCPTFLAPGRDCRLSVSYTATARGRHSGTLTVTSNASNSPTTASLTGTGR